MPGGWATGPNDGYFLQRLVHHLIEAGQRDELLPLLTDYRFLDAKLRGVGVQSLVEDYERACATVADAGPPMSRRVAQADRGALRLSSHILARDPDQLPSQLWGRRDLRDPPSRPCWRHAGEAEAGPCRSPDPPVSPRAGWRCCAPSPGIAFAQAVAVTRWTAAGRSPPTTRR